MLGAVNLRRLGEDRRAALSHQQIGSDAERRVGGHAAIAVGATAIGAQHQVRGRQSRALHVVDLRQQLGHRLDAGLDGLADAAALLDAQYQRRLLLLAVQLEQMFVFDEVGGRAGLAAEPHDDVSGHVRVPGKARQRARRRLRARLRILPRLSAAARRSRAPLLRRL